VCNFLRLSSTVSVLGPYIILDTSSQTPSVYGHPTGFLFVFRRVHVVAKSALYLHVRLSACTSAACTGWLFVKFGIGDSYENLSKNPNLVKI
jgi:hypothetical protein